jgi:hypothetical protein
LANPPEKFPVGLVVLSLESAVFMARALLYPKYLPVERAAALPRLANHPFKE